MSNKLKQITTKAKALYKSGKYSKWTDAIKAASKTLSHTVSKKAKKVSGVNDIIWIFDVHKDINTTAKKQIKVKASNRTSAYNKARKRYPYPYFVELHSTQNIGAVKNKLKPKKKHSVKKSDVKSYHKDTKSHNVNIRVMSGITKGQFNMLNVWQNVYGKLAKDYVISTNVKDRHRIKKEMHTVKLIISDIKKIKSL